MFRLSVKWAPMAAGLLLSLLGFRADWLMLLGIDSATAAEISYVYDDLDRLKAVVDPATDTAVYHYDTVGNLLSISRQSSSDVSIIEFTPKSGPVGTTTVTIYGTGFSTTPSQNTVQFNGVVATVASSTETRIVTTVPSGATTGAIGVTTPTGSATSAMAFTVAPNGAPTLTGFTPSIATAGTPLTITGTNFDTVPLRTKVKVGAGYPTVSSVTSTSIGTTVPTSTGSGRISVSTPRGQATSANYLFIPPAPYVATDVAYTGSMVIGGGSHTATISTPNKIALIVFEGTAAQVVGLGVNSSTFGGLNMYIYKPDGTVLTQGGAGTGTNFDMTLPVTGTYTILFDPSGTSTGSVTLTLSTEIDAGTITINGASATATIGRVGQRARMRFDGTAGQLVGLGVNSSTFAGLNMYIYKPDGTVLTQGGAGTGTNFDMTLPVTGTYTILFDPSGTSTGSVTLTLSTEIDAGTITINGASATATIGRVGQRARMRFDGTAAQVVGLGVNSSTFGGLNMYIYKPDGTVLTQGGAGTGTNFDMTLPVTGTYTILFDPSGTSTGSVTLTLSTEIDAGTITINGASATATIGRVGQRARMRFDGTAGQLVGLGVNSSTFAGLNMYIYKPDGTVLTQGGAGTGTNFDMTLPVTGTYTILFDPTGTSTGSMTLTLSTEIDAGTITINGASATATIGRVGQRARMRFDGTAGQLVGLGVNSSTFAGLNMYIYKPDGTVLTQGGAGTGTNFDMTLPVTGTYTILFDPTGTSTGSMTLTLSTEIDAGTITINGASATATIGRVGQRARMRFDGTAGQLVGLGVNSSTFAGLNMYIYKPDGTVLTQGGAGTGTNFDMTLPVTGTYTILFDPNGTSTGSVTLTLIHL